MVDLMSIRRRNDAHLIKILHRFGRDTQCEMARRNRIDNFDRPEFHVETMGFGPIHRRIVDFNVDSTAIR